MNSFVLPNELEPWVPPEERPPPPEADADAADGADAEARIGGRKRGREGMRGKKSSLPQWIEEAGGLKLWLDPRRTTDGYTGTGYRGVYDDYNCNSANKKAKPFVVVHEGKGCGRFATVEQAAVQYARIEIGMPPLVMATSKFFAG